jgi:nucleoside-diphosphate-sugar epimerase
LKAQSADSFDIVNVSSQETISINRIATIIAQIMHCEHINIKNEENEDFWKKYPQLFHPKHVDRKICLMCGWHF